MNVASVLRGRMLMDWGRQRQGVVGDVVAAVAGALLVLAFAPFDLYPLAIVALAALFWLLTGISLRRAAWRGFLFGAAEFAFGIYWIYISVHEVNGAPAWLTLVLVLVLVSIMAAYSALACALGLWLAPRSGAIRWLLVLPAVWTLLEWLRSWFLTGFPWLSLGYSQIDSSLKGYAPVLGVFGVSLAVASSAGLVVSLCAPDSRPRRRLLSLILLVAVWGGGAILASVPWTRPAGPAIAVSLIQGDIPQDLKWAPEMLVPTLDRYRKLTEEHWSSRLIIWPEAAVPAYYDEVQQDFLAPLQQEARAHHTDILLGVPIHDWNTDAYYNSVISLGSHDGVYNKHHLVPLAEFFPVPGWVRRWLEAMDLPYSDFTRGAVDQPLLRVAGYPVGISICYEDAFGNEIMRGLPQAAFLVNVSNDAWFGDSIALPQHFEIARLRALEAGRYLMRDTNTGITAIVDPAGRIVKQLAVDSPGVLTANVTPYAGSTPYVRLGNSVVVLICLLLILAAGWGARRWRWKPSRWQRIFGEGA